jgi:Leucine-rich repeat (LRR) protein
LEGRADIRELDLIEENLEGSLNLEGFTNLEDVYCSGNDKLTHLTLIGCPRLSSLNCNYNRLTELDIRENLALTYLSLESNKLTALNVSSQNKLEYVDLRDNDSLKE